MKKHLEPDSGIIVLNNLTKRFNGKVVLDGISLAVEKGRTTVVIGPSGCGKTVLIKHMIVLERPSSGQVYFGGRRIDELPEAALAEIRTHYGFCFQMGALFDSLTVYENIAFPIRQHSKITDWKQVDEIVKQKLALVGMDGYQQQYPADISGGQRKRVALARAIALSPEIILYDEPTTGLDPIRADIINELIIKLKKQLDVTSIVVTHDMSSAYKIADRIVMLSDGRIIADGGAEHIRTHPHPVVQQFIQGHADDADLAALRLGGTKFSTQYLPEDFR